MNNQISSEYHLPWWTKALIGAMGGICLSLLKLIYVKFHIGSTNHNEVLAAYLTYLAYITLEMIVAVFFTDHELPKQKREKNALMLGLLAPSILIAIVASPPEKLLTPAQQKQEIPSLGSIIVPSAYADDVIKNSDKPKIELKLNQVNVIDKEQVQTSFGTALLKAMGRKVEPSNHVLVVGSTESDEKALGVANKINENAICSLFHLNVCAKVVKVRGTKELYVKLVDLTRRIT